MLLFAIEVRHFPGPAFLAIVFDAL